ncbi:MAG: polysaccharide pyruvyl transferase family protein [Agathobacter sp.]|nr:polysaccharide pyruvyl transferase family protein [Agathobacter sp.]
MSQKKYDVAIYGATMGANYGGLVTYYALYKAIEEMGYSVVMIMPTIPKDGEASVTFATTFCQKYHEVTERVNFDDLKQFNDIADTFVLGSDQIWNYTLFKGKRESFYLDFVDYKKKKIAYAASFGFSVPTIFPKHVDRYPRIYKLMKRLDHIGVREDDAVTVCKDYYDVGAKHVLDPVFLTDKENYLELAANAPRKPEGAYMCVYCITPKESANKAFQFVSKELNLPRVNMGTGNARKYEMRKVNFDMEYMENVILEEWLYNIINSDFIVTDSYHCLCFSIIFRKKFVIVQDKWATSRIKSLLELLGLEDRWFESSEELEQNPDILYKDIDYDKVHEILKREVIESKTWLKNSIESDKKVIVRKKIRDYSDAKDDKRFAKLYKAKNINSYFRALQSVKKDVVYMIAKRGTDNGELAKVRFPRSAEIKKQTKLDMLNEGFSLICDYGNRQKISSIDDVSHCYYKENGIEFSVLSEGNKFKNKRKSAEFYVENKKKRTAYITKKDGLFVWVYSKSLRKVIDYVQVDISEGSNLEITRLD